MITAHEAREIVINCEVNAALRQSLEDIERLIQIKANDGGCQISYQLKDKGLVSPVSEALVSLGFTVTGGTFSDGFLNITIGW